MEINTILYIIGAILIVYGYVKYSNKKKEVGQFSMLIGAVIVAAVFFGAAGSFASLSIGPTGNDIPTSGVPDDSDICAVTGPLVYAQLNFSGDTWRQSGANSPTGPAGDVQFYMDGTDVTIPGVTALDTISVTAGVGSTTNKILKSCSDYEIYYDGASAEYDIAHPTGRLTPVNTNTGEIPSQTVEFHDIKVFATIGDLIEENAVDGTVNGQSNVNGSVGCNGELQVGADETPADGDTIYYNETNGDTQFYLDIDIEATGGDKVLKEPVLCFVNLANPMEGDEFSLVTMTHRSGTNFGTPVTITDYFSNQKCVPLGDEMISGESGTYRLDFTVVHANTDATTDVLYLIIDDLKKHLGEDLLGDKKATPAQLVLQFRA